MSDIVTGALIAAASAIITAIINGIFNIAIKKIEKQPIKTTDNKTDRKDKISTKGLIAIFSVVFVLLIVGYLLFFNQRANSTTNLWIGYWKQTADWGNKSISNGPLTFYKIEKDSIFAISYNKRIEKTDLKGILINNGKEIIGQWTMETGDKGSFSFKLESSNNFNGIWEFKGDKKLWNGVKLNKFTHKVVVVNPKTNNISFRNKILTQNEIDEIISGKETRIDKLTLIRNLSLGDSLVLLDDVQDIKPEIDFYKIMTIYKNELRIGYITKTDMTGKKTIDLKND